MSAEIVQVQKDRGSTDLPKPANSWLATGANIVSYIFHPVFIPFYVIYFLLYVQPFMVSSFSPRLKTFMLIQTFLMYTFFPLVSVLLLKALKFIPSIKLATQKERIIPYIVCNIWYFWIWYVWRGLDYVPLPFVIFALSIFLSSSIGLLCNIYLKVSMHAIAMSIAVSFLLSLAFNGRINFAVYTSIAILLAGLVSSARLQLNSHTVKEMVVGFLAGATGFAIAMAVN